MLPAYARTEFTPSLNSESSLAVGTTNDVYQFRYLLTLIDFVAACNRVFDAMRDVILQHFFLDAAERGTNRGNLRDDIDAVTIVFDHFKQAADLAFDTAQSFLA